MFPIDCSSFFVSFPQALHLSSTRLQGGASNSLNLLRPLDRGEITDYSTIQKILDHIFKHELRINPKDHPVMLTVSPLCSPESRAEMAKLLFDVFNVPSLCMANQAVLSLYSTGRTTGVVLELGEGMTYCVPVYEGFALKHAVLSIPVAGGDLTKYLMRNLGERGFNFLDSQADTVRDIKEKLCRVKQTKSDYSIVPAPGSNLAAPAAPSASMTGTPDVDETSYELPDGQMIRLDEFCRFNTLEILFQPHQYAQALGTALTGGANQSFGIPAQPTPGSAAGLSALASSGGGSSQQQQQQPQSAGGLGSSGSFANAFSSTGGAGNTSGGGGGGASRGGDGVPRSGPISIDLSTNELLGVHHLLHTSLRMVDAFLRRELLKNIVLAGGTSMAKGFGERVKRELTNLLDQDSEHMAQMNASASSMANGGGAGGMGGVGANGGQDSQQANTLNIVTDSQRKYAAWIGASMYASLPTFSIIKITADQYKRDENTVHKKFF